MWAESVSSRWVGTWYVPYLADPSYTSESRYLHCRDTLQSAVTHSGQTRYSVDNIFFRFKYFCAIISLFPSTLSSMWVVSFQWRPPANFSGLVQFRATVVESYEVFWLGVTSAALAVTEAGARLPGAALGGDPRTSYYNPSQGQGGEGEEEGVSYPDFVSLFQDYPGLENSSSDGITAESAKSNMSRAVLSVTTHQVGGNSGYLKHYHDLASPLHFLVCVCQY